MINFSQSYEQELLKSYSKKELSSMSKEEMEVLHYALEHATYFVDLNDKPETGSFEEILISPDKIKFTDYKVRIDDSNQYFVDKSLGKMLVVKSWYVLKNELNHLK